MGSGGARRRSAARSVAAVGLLALLAVGCSEDPDPSATTDDPTPTLAAGPLRVERTHVGAEGVPDDVVEVDGAVLVLVSDDDDRLGGEHVLRSADGGRTWTRSATGLPADGTPGNEWPVVPTRPRLLTAGPVVFASRSWSPQLDDPTGIRADQALVRSDDQGTTWSPVDLPAPDGHTALVSAAAEIDGTVVLAGALQRDPVSGEAAGFVEGDLDAYDAAAWTSSDGGRTFEAATSPAFAGVPGLQSITRLLATGDRLVAIGRDWRGELPASTSFASPDGRSWRALDGFASASIDLTLTALPPRLVDGAVELGHPRRPYALPAGATTWELPTSDEEELSLYGTYDAFDGGADTTPSAEPGGLIGTWTYSSACDCSEAMAGRIGGGQPETGTVLDFDGCDDRSIRGETGVEPPHRLGDAVVALAWCNDRNVLAAAVAHTTDEGRTWQTDRLTDLAPAGWIDLLATPSYDARLSVVVDGALVVATVADPDAPPSESVMSDALLEPTPVVLLRVTAG